MHKKPRVAKPMKSAGKAEPKAPKAPKVEPAPVEPIVRTETEQERKNRLAEKVFEFIDQMSASETLNSLSKLYK
jgi:hypothetical protein